jgi:ABC-2 type transport system permease protein
VSSVTQAARELFGNTNPLAPEPTAWPLLHPELYTLIWSAVIMAIFIPLAGAQYKKATSR